MGKWAVFGMMGAIPVVGDDRDEFRIPGTSHSFRGVFSARSPISRALVVLFPIPDDLSLTDA